VSINFADYVFHHGKDYRHIGTYKWKGIGKFFCCGIPRES
jgi:hypothetical protein